MITTDEVLQIVAYEGAYDETGGTLGDRDWETALAQSTNPPEDLAGYIQEMQATNR